MYNFVKIITKNNTLIDALNGWCKLSVVFDGGKLNFLEQFNLKRLFSKHYVTKINLIFGVHDNNTKEEKLALPEHNSSLNLSDEIKKILNEINTLSSKLPEQIKKTINQKTTKLLDEYKKGMTQKNQRPTLNFDEENTELKLETMVPETVLLLSLKKMKLDFSSYEKLLKDLSSVYKCKELLKTEVDKKPDELNTLEEIILSIIYLTNKIDDKMKKEIIDTVEKTLSNAEIKYNNDLNNLFGNDNDLLVFEDVITNQQLKIDLLNILDDLTKYSLKVMPYLELLEVLKNNEVATYVEGDSINDTIITMKYIIPFITNPKLKEELLNEVSSFCDEYINKIEKILDNHSTIKEGDYEKLEKEISKRIHPILEKLNLYSHKDENEKDILTQLSNSIKILNSTDLVELNNKKAIESWIGELHNKIINNNQVLDNEKEEIKQKLLNIINKWIDDISKMSNDENMNGVMYSMLKDLAGVHINVNTFLDNLSKFNNKKL